jgi:hypothetical protein
MSQPTYTDDGGTPVQASLINRMVFGMNRNTALQRSTSVSSFQNIQHTWEPHSDAKLAEEVDRPANIVELRKDVWATGSIEVSFKYVTNIRRVPVAADSYRKQLEELRPLGAIPEKALKGDARSHQIM